MKTSANSIATAFQRLRDLGWDVASPLNWSYYFIDEDKDALMDLYNWVKERGYSIRSLESDDQSDFLLKLSKREIHNADSLHERNCAMNRLAQAFHVRAYDGWEVEK